MNQWEYAPSLYQVSSLLLNTEILKLKYYYETNKNSFIRTNNSNSNFLMHAANFKNFNHKQKLNFKILKIIAIILQGYKDYKTKVRWDLLLLLFNKACVDCKTRWKLSYKYERAELLQTELSPGIDWSRESSGSIFEPWDDEIIQSLTKD